MGFYELSAQERAERVANIYDALSDAIAGGQPALRFCGDGYKKGCFRLLAAELLGWGNPYIYEAFKAEAIAVHGRYEKFSELTSAQVKEYFKREQNTWFDEVKR